MRSIRIIGLTALALVFAPLSAVAQVDTRPYNSVAQSIETAVKAEYPNYARTSIPPAQPSGSLMQYNDDVIIDQWTSDEATVRVAIVVYPSKEDAKKAYKEFIANVKVTNSLSDVGSESYVWGIVQSVAFRKGRYSVFIDATPLQERGPMDSPPPPVDRIKYSKGFAKVVAKALKDE